MVFPGRVDEENGFCRRMDTFDHALCEISYDRITKNYIYGSSRWVVHHQWLAKHPRHLLFVQISRPGKLTQLNEPSNQGERVVHMQSRWTTKQRHDKGSSIGSSMDIAHGRPHNT